MSETTERRVYVGKPVNCPGWEVYAEAAHPNVDWVGPLHRLSCYEDGAVSILYVNSADAIAPEDILAAVNEWFRVLRPGGALICAGIDVGAAGRALELANFDEQTQILALLNGKSRWTEEVLTAHLRLAGFKQLRRATDLKLFADVSQTNVQGVALGLNLLATRP